MHRRSALLAAVPLVALAAALGGCSAEGVSTADVTVRADGVPFTFEVPPEFTDEQVGERDTRGDVVLVRALDKVDVIAVRRVGGATLPAGDVPGRVLGKAVTSRLHAVPGAPGWALECQWTAARRGHVLDACAKAVRTLRLR
ncbi:MAG TPA: hypothetical protein VHB30_04740, partial [Solirubrobacteraceae bacterium]|jgi:hypothetical protein|nr:hypothetical protein [Solirubrobacteraceae bacterium]